MTAKEPTGQYLVQYRGRNGWWTGHHGVDLKDPDAYAIGLNKRDDCVARIVDKETGQIWGQPGCSICGDPHEGEDGACLI